MRLLRELRVREGTSPAAFADCPRGTARGDWAKPSSKADRPAVPSSPSSSATETAEAGKMVATQCKNLVVTIERYSVY